MTRRSLRAAALTPFVLAAVLLPVTGGTALADPPVDVRVMTWNVRTSDFGPSDWATVINDLRPDVLTLQETCAAEAPKLVDELRAYGRSTPRCRGRCGTAPT